MFLRLILSALIAAAIAFVSGLPYGSVPEHGILRLSWRSVGEKVRTTTERPGEEVPLHMRPQQDYEERMRDYQLTATIDGNVWLDQVMRPPGLHRDRPISVFEETALLPGRYRVQLKYWPVPDEGATWKPEIDCEIEIEAGRITTLTITDQGEP